MDKISVTDEALQTAIAVLRQLSEASEMITGKCVSALSSTLTGLDDALRKDVQGVLEKTTFLKEKMRHCMDENVAALAERTSKIPDYENQAYKPRNIV